MFNVLITGCSLHLKDLVYELKRHEEDVYVVGVNCDENALLHDEVDKSYVVPRVTDERYLKDMLSICQSERIQIVIPFITSELAVLERNKEAFDKIGVKVSTSSLESLQVLNDKKMLCEKYPQYMPEQIVPKSWSDIQRFCAKQEDAGRNICIKLSDMCGGIGFAVVNDERSRNLRFFNKYGMNRYISLCELKSIFRHRKYDIIVQEYVDGMDYSLCTLATRGSITASAGFEAYVMSYGAAMSAKIVKNEKAEQIASQIVADTAFDGNACFDFVIRKNGEVKLLEVNPRVTATLGFIAHAGLDLLYMRCKQLLGEDFANDQTLDIGLRMRKNYCSEYFR